MQNTFKDLFGGILELESLDLLHLDAQHTRTEDGAAFSNHFWIFKDDADSAGAA